MRINLAVYDRNFVFEVVSWVTILLMRNLKFRVIRRLKITGIFKYWGIWLVICILKMSWNVFLSDGDVFEENNIKDF